MMNKRFIRFAVCLLLTWGVIAACSLAYSALSGTIGIPAWLILSLAASGVPVLFFIYQNRDKSQIDCKGSPLQAEPDIQSVAIMEERSRLARELHDSAAQALGYTMLQTQTIEELLQADKTGEALHQLQRLTSTVRCSYNEIRQDILALRASSQRSKPFLDRLKDYVEQFQELTGLPVNLRVRSSASEIQLSLEAELQILRIVQEALANASKHSQASAVMVCLCQQKKHFTLCIVDNGCGFESADNFLDDWMHAGLRTMYERAESIGARLIIRTNKAQGVRIFLLYPDNPVMEEHPCESCLRTIIPFFGKE